MFRLLFSQWLVLIQRNFRVLLADKINLSLLALQVPLIAVLIISAFYDFEQDKQSFDEAARMLYYFGVMKAPLQQADKTVNVDTLYRYAGFLARESDDNKRWDYIHNEINPYFQQRKVSLPDFTLPHANQHEIQPISNLTSLRRGSVYFLLVAASIWFGIMASCKEIVTEQPVLRREVRSYLFLAPYLAAKALVLAIILGIQTMLLAAIVVPLLLKLSYYYIIGIGLILWIAAFAAAALGLFISCIVTRYRVALTLVPLLMIPQLLFGGLLRPPVDVESSWSHITNILSALTIQRWAYESILTTDAYAKGGILKLQINPDNSELNLVQTENISLVNSFFAPRAHMIWSLWMPLAYLLTSSLLFLIGGYIALRWRFSY